MVGGVLEYTALLSGYRSLLFVVAGAYALALVASRRSARNATGGVEHVCPPGPAKVIGAQDGQGIHR